jgi:hypothetical protein
MTSEPREWTSARRQRMEQQYPELTVANAQQVLRTDMDGVNRGIPPTRLSQTLMSLAAATGQK